MFHLVPVLVTRHRLLRHRMVHRLLQQLLSNLLWIAWLWPMVTTLIQRATAVRPTSLALRATPSLAIVPKERFSIPAVIYAIHSPMCHRVRVYRERRRLLAHRRFALHDQTIRSIARKNTMAIIRPPIVIKIFGRV